MKTSRKIMLLLLGIIAIMLFAAVQWYRAIEAPEWAAQKAAVQKAYQKTPLTKAVKVVPFVGERPFMVVFGTDKLKQNMIVWVSDQGTHAEYASDGISAEEAAGKVTARDPRNQVLRTSPGKLYDDFVWEVFYRNTTDDSYYYDYFRFSDGKYIDTYNLTLQ